MFRRSVLLEDVELVERHPRPLTISRVEIKTKGQLNVTLTFSQGDTNVQPSVSGVLMATPRQRCGR
jgi:hypothetical protein